MNRTAASSAYDPFARGPFPVGVRPLQAHDTARDRLFPAEVRYPGRLGPCPLVIYSHGSGGHRRSATFLSTHLASHGYAVATLDHSEVFVPELARPEEETDARRAARVEAIVASRVPDLRFLLDHLLRGGPDGDDPDGAGPDGAGPDSAGPDSAGPDSAGPRIELDASRIGLVGHSFGGWTVLATTEVEPRARAVVAHAPGGSTNPRPGVPNLPLTFGWSRDVPTLYLAAEHDVPIPPAAVRDVFDRTPSTKRMVTLQRADHQHFVDDVEGEHETVRTTSFPGIAAWMPAAMRPVTELCPGDQAHLFVRGLTLAHLDATLCANPAAERFLAGDIEAELATRGIAAIAHRP